jgi:hypothetical protein
MSDLLGVRVSSAPDGILIPASRKAPLLVEELEKHVIEFRLQRNLIVKPMTLNPGKRL